MGKIFNFLLEAMVKRPAVNVVPEVRRNKTTCSCVSACATDILCGERSTKNSFYLCWEAAAPKRRVKRKARFGVVGEIEVISFC